MQPKNEIYYFFFNADLQHFEISPSYSKADKKCYLLFSDKSGFILEFAIFAFDRIYEVKDSVFLVSPRMK